MRWLPSILGALALLFGLACLNYTTAGGVDHHSAWALERGLPVPGSGIFALGVVCTVVGSAAIGFAIGRRRR